MKQAIILFAALTIGFTSNTVKADLEQVIITRAVKATAYNAFSQQTDSTPTICAWGDKIRPGIIAISRDLEKIGLTRGQEVHVEGFGKRTVMDRMHRRKRNQIDLYMESHKEAIRFGVQTLTISWTE